MKKLQVIIIVLFISLTICTLANFQVNAQSATIGTAGKMQSNWVFMAQNMEPRWLKHFEPSLTCTATINPTTANAGETKTYVIQIVNLQKAPPSYSGGTLKCANITIPSGFSSVTVTSAKHYDSNGNLKTTWNYGADASQIWVWEGSQGGDGATRGQYVNVTFSAKAPTSLGTYSWTTYVYKNAPSSSPFMWPTFCNSLGAVYGSQPTVTVSTAAGAATHLVVSSGIVQVAGTPFTVTVTAEDAYGNTAKGYTGTVHFSSSDSGSGVNLPSNYAFQAGDNGVKSFSVTLVTVGSQSVTATDTVTGSITGSQNSIIVNVGSLNHISVSPSAPSVTAGGQQTFVSTAYDQFNNLIGTVTSSTTWSIQSGAGGSWVQSTGTYTSQYSGSWTVTAVYSGKTATATLTVNAGTLASVSVSGPGSVTAGGTATFTATGYDALGNSLGVQTASWSIDAGAAGSWIGNVYTSHTAGSWTVTATVSGHTGTASLTVNAGSATHLVVSSGTSQVAGTPFTVTVTAEDAHGNTAAAYSGTVHFTSSDGQAVLPANSALSSGTGTFSLTLKTAGSQSITTTDTVTSSITGSESGIMVNHAAAASSVVVISPSGASVTAGATKTYSAEATDAYGNNWDATGSVTWSISSGAGGSWSSNVYTSATAGTWTVTADNGAGVTGTASLTVTHASAVSIAVSPATDSITAGNPETYSAEATDAYGNNWDATGSVTWSISSGAGGSWSSNVYTSATAGSWTVTGTYETTTATAQLTVNAVTYQITVTQSVHGTIVPGTTTVNYGATPSFTITPDAGYYIASITANGASVTVTSPSGQSYQFSAVSADGSLTATFAINTFTITVTQGANGVIAPGTTTVNYGATQSFTITPSTGYSIASLTVDGSPVAVASTYTFSNIQAPHTVSATFAITSTTPTASPPSPTPTGSPSPTPTVSPSSPRPTATPSSPTPTISPLSPTPTGSSPSPTPTVSPPSPTPLYLVLAAIIIAAAIIISVIAIKRSRRKPDNTLPNVLAANEKQEIASLKGKIGKIKNLEAEKKNLLLEIEELKKMADAKATALENEVGTLRDKVKSQKILMHRSEPRVDQRLKQNYKNKTF